MEAIPIEFEPQKWFNRAYLGVMRQGCIAAGVDGCVYRNVDNGSRCAFGHIMKGVVPEETSEIWDALSTTAEDLYDLRMIDIPQEGLAFAMDLQTIHDGCWNGDELTGDLGAFDHKMRAFAMARDLEVPTL